MYRSFRTMNNNKRISGRDGIFSSFTMMIKWQVTRKNGFITFSANFTSGVLHRVRTLASTQTAARNNLQHWYQIYHPCVKSVHWIKTRARSQSREAYAAVAIFTRPSRPRIMRNHIGFDIFDYSVLSPLQLHKGAVNVNMKRRMFDAGNNRFAQRARSLSVTRTVFSSLRKSSVIAAEKKKKKREREKKMGEKGSPQHRVSRVTRNYD